MRLRHETSAQKLRGGYYTAAPLVDWCLDRVACLATSTPRRWLEPAAGDGAFVRGLARMQAGGRLGPCELDAIELDPTEAAACTSALRQSGLSGRVVNDTFFAWASTQQPGFNALVGNPPYVPYQFVGKEDRRLAEDLTSRLGLTLRGVSNLWIPFALVSLSLLRPGGVFALVLPSELFCTVSGGLFRTFVIRNFTSLQVDLFPRRTFPSILQDVVVVSGKRAVRSATRRPVNFCEHGGSSPKPWCHHISVSPESWQRYLLAPEEVQAFHDACRLAGVHRLGGVASMEVSIVTGANPFFTVDDATVAEFSLQPWSRPLLARSADAPGIAFVPDDHDEARRRGSRAWILDFSAQRPEPNGHPGVRDYLAKGEALGLHERYKCRIRSPWYRVPQMKRGRLMLPKRAHRHHKLMLNRAGVFTTDTVYRGEMLALFAEQEEDLVAGFQNTLTLLSAEVEGGTYGGGVLELVPSEIARLQVPLVSAAPLLREIDVTSRGSRGQRGDGECVIELTDRALVDQLPGYAALLPALRIARTKLLQRRMDATDLQPSHADPGAA